MSVTIIAAFYGARELEGKKGLVKVGVAAFVIFLSLLSPVPLSGQTAANIAGHGSIGNPLIGGLPSANVYVVRNDGAGNYVTVNGSNMFQVLETNTNPVTAINNAITHWVPMNGKIVTNGTMVDWNGTVTPSHGSFTWEAWKTKAVQMSTQAAWLAGVNLLYGRITIDNFTYVGRDVPNRLDIGIRSSGASYLTIENCTISGCTGMNAVSIGGGVGHSVRFNNVSFNDGAYQICFNTVSDSVISHNFVDAGHNGSCIGVFGDNVNGYKNVTTSFNVLSNWGPSILWHGFYTTGTAFSYVYNNTFTPSSTTGGADCNICAYGASVYNNTFDGKSGASWAVAMTQQTAVNYYSPNGTRLYSNVIRNYANGILLSSGFGHSIGNITVSDNLLTNCTTGIQMVSESSTVYNQNCTIARNTVTKSGGTYGIRLGYADPEDYSNSTKILNNTISGYAFGLWIYAHALNPIINFNAFSSITIEAIHEPSSSATFRFNTGLTGYSMLNVTVVGNGSTSPSGLGWQYQSGSTVSINWTPDTGYNRQNISIDGTYQNTTVSPVDVTMSANHVVIAYFTKIP